MAFADSFANYAITADEKEKLDEMGLECPEDCAFAFTCFAEASAHGVGGAWLATRRSARAMTSVASASWRSIAGFQVQTKHGVSASPAAEVDKTPVSGPSDDQGQLTFSPAAEGGASLCEVWPMWGLANRQSCGRRGRLLALRGCQYALRVRQLLV